MIDEFTENISIREALKKYLKVRTTNRSLTIEQWELILDKLKQKSNMNVSYGLKLIEDATAGGWMKIVYDDNFKSNNIRTSYSSVDNTASHFTGNPKITDNNFYLLDFEHQKAYLNNMALTDMTPIQKEFFEKYCLARDDNGNLLTF